MKKITKQDLIAGVLKKFSLQYPSEKTEIKRRLRMEKPKTEAEVAAIIGNDSWTRNECSICEKDVEEVVSLDTEEYPFAMCRKCLADAVKTIETI